jgi:hypothetical protein
MANNTQKKSFNISLDYAHADQRLLGYKTLNLNNSFQDPSFLREVFYQHQIRRHIPAAQSNFVHLNINGQDWGIYPNVQQLDKTFLKEWFFSNNGVNWRADRPDGAGGGGPGGPGGGPGWGDGTAALNYLGGDTATYQQYYTLKSSEVDHPWDILVATTDALNNTPIANLPEVLPDYLDIDRTLWFLASEIVFTDDDSYVYKGKMDYYLYYEVETGRMTPLEYDGNSSLALNFATSWSPFYNANKVNYPLLNKMLAVPQWRQRYLAHLRTLIAESLQPTQCAAILEHYKTQINELVQSDPKKIYTYNQFVSEVEELKQFIVNRRNYLLNQVEVAQTAPEIASVALSNAAGSPWGTIHGGETPYVSAEVTATNGIAAVRLYYASELTGNFTPVEMLDDGAHHDGAAGDGVFGADLPAFPAGTWVRFYVEAAANNTAQSVSYMPVGAEHDVFVYHVEAAVAQGPVVINELMASNTMTVTDEEGVYEDWFELYNNSNTAVDLSGYYLTDNPDNLTKFQIAPGTTIAPNGYLIFWADEDSADGPFHTNFRLSINGEQLLLLNPNTVIVDQVTFGLQESDKGYARVPNGTGNFVIQAPTFNANNTPSSVQEPGDLSEFQLTPNPASQAVVLTLVHSTPQPVEISDVHGRLMWRQTKTLEHKTLIDVSQWMPGVYWVRCGASVKKLIVQP